MDVPTPSTSIRIRRARPADCEELTAVAHAAKRHWGYPEDYVRLWEADLTVTAELVHEARVYVAQEGEEIVAFYALAGTPPALDLEHFWVRPGRIRQGVGTTLFAHAIQIARATDATAITIASDPNAVGFYERMGAHRVGEEPSTIPGRTLPVLHLDV